MKFFRLLGMIERGGEERGGEGRGLTECADV